MSYNKTNFRISLLSGLMLSAVCAGSSFASNIDSEQQLPLRRAATNHKVLFIETDKLDMAPGCRIVADSIRVMPRAQKKDENSVEIGQNVSIHCDTLATLPGKIIIGGLKEMKGFGIISAKEIVIRK